MAIAAALGVVAVMALRWFQMRYRAKARITYGDGTIVNSAPGRTLLEVSRANGIAHMSVCGGRARCSTCRTLIVAGNDNLTTPTEAEAHLLGKLSAGSDVRLACQARVRGDVSVRLLIQPQASVNAPRNADPLGWGVEREIAVLFLDIRGFSKISEKSLPYDVVFILNSLFGEVGSEIEKANGYIDKFMGDGLMALFGLNSTPQEASRDAIRAAIAAQRATTSASRMLTQHLNEPLRVGIGVHTGMAVIGRIGRTADQTQPSRLTAIGDSVNIAARLESATKELACSIVLSGRTLELAGLPVRHCGRRTQHDNGAQHLAARGRAGRARHRKAGRADEPDASARKRKPCVPDPAFGSLRAALQRLGKKPVSDDAGAFLKRFPCYRGFVGAVQMRHEPKLRHTYNACGDRP